MTDRYADTEPLIPDWAAPAYLWVSGATSLVYFGLVYLAAGGELAIVKTLSILLLAAYAGFSRAPMLAIALLLSAGGDFALAMDPPARETGIGFFASAHLAYIAIFTLIILRTGIRRDGLILAAGLLVFGGALYWWLSPGMGALQGVVTAYIVIILGMAILAGLVQGPRLIALGAVLFVLSDSLIAAGWFRGLEVSYGRFDLAAMAIWITYYAAQMCLALGVVRWKRGRAE
jgi:uncharacterized membrane protein YhhN